MLGDGHVPILANFHDGNTSDSDTHIANWDMLKAHLGREDFLYISDSKGATMENIAHIAKYGGKFISVLPGSRKEAQVFRNALSKGELEVEWQPILYKSGRKNQEEKNTYQTLAANTEEQKTKEGYTIHWIQSSSKEEKEAMTRVKKLTKAEEELTNLSTKLNKYYLKEQTQIETAVEKILAPVKGLIDVKIIEHKEIKQVKVGRGRIGKNSKFTEQIHVDYAISWSKNEEQILAQRKADGIFPLVTNTSLTGKQVLEKYKNQPYLEKKFSTLIPIAIGSVIDAVPVFLKLPHRIEAMLFLYFIALMIIALIERQIGRAMKEEEIEKLPILPQKMNTTKPTWNNIRYFFRDVYFLARDIDNQAIETITKGLTKLHQTILRLLGVPKSLYVIDHNLWWKFKTG